MAHNGSMCPLWCTTHKHLLDVGVRGAGLQRQEAQKRTAWTWPQFIPESEPALKTPSWQQHLSRRWTSYHEEQERQSFNTMGVYRGDRTADNGITSSRAKQRKDTSKGEGKHRICNSKLKSVLTNGENHSVKPWKSLVQTRTASTNPHRFTQTPIDSCSSCQTLKPHIQHLKWAKTPLMQELILILN